MRVDISTSAQLLSKAGSAEEILAGVIENHKWNLRKASLLFGNLLHVDR